MKFIAHILATAAICFILQSFLPWWSMAIGSAAVSYFVGNNGWQSFIAGLLGVGLLWLGMAFYIDSSTHAILSEKINKLLPLNVIVLTPLVGGIVGGLSALTGSLLKLR